MAMDWLPSQRGFLRKTVHKKQVPAPARVFLCHLRTLVGGNGCNVVSWSLFWEAHHCCSKIKKEAWVKIIVESQKATVLCLLPTVMALFSKTTTLETLLNNDSFGKGDWPQGKVRSWGPLHMSRLRHYRNNGSLSPKAKCPLFQEYPRPEGITQCKIHHLKRKKKTKQNCYTHLVLRYKTKEITWAFWSIASFLKWPIVDSSG